MANNVVEFHNVGMIQQLHDFDFSFDTLGLIVDVVNQTPIDNFDGILKAVFKKQFIEKNFSIFFFFFFFKKPTWKKQHKKQFISIKQY